MIIFLYGPDDYRRAQKKKELIAEFRKKRSDLGLDFFDLDAGPSELERLDGFLRNQPIFESAKLVVLENAFEMPADKLAKIIKPFIDQKGMQILISEKDKPLKALSFLLEKPVVFQKFEPLSEIELQSFIKSEAAKFGVAIAPSAAQFLAAAYAGNSWGIVTELQKLSSLHGGEGKKTSIEKNDLDEMGLEIAPNYWALLNGLKGYDMKSRLYAFEKMLASNDPPPKIFNILASQWQEKIPLMAAYDLAIKSGKLDYEEALTDLLIS
jgi:DNA polymerase III delta subunit